MASSGLSKLPAEVLADILGRLDSSEDLRACLYASPIMWHSYMWKPNTILSAVTCRSIGYDCFHHSLAIIRFPELPTGMSRDDLRRRIVGYLLRVASQNFQLSHSEAKLLCQLDCVIMRFVGDLVRKAMRPDRKGHWESLPSWTHPSFTRDLTDDTEQLDLSKAELMRYKLAFLHRKLFHLLFVRTKLPGLFNVQELSNLLFRNLEEYDIAGIEAVHAYLRRLHARMLEDVEDAMQQVLCKASQRYIRTQSEPALDKKAPIPGMELQPPADMISLGEVVREVFPHLDQTTRIRYIDTLTQQDIVTVYKRIRSGPESFRSGFRAEPRRDDLPDIHDVCAKSIVQLWSSNISTPFRKGRTETCG